MKLQVEAGTVRFAGMELDLRSGELKKNSRVIRLQDQPFRLLKLLLKQPGEVVRREELQRQLWPGATFVDFDHGLHKAIAKLRDVLDDPNAVPSLIETLPRRGYRFKAKVEWVGSPNEELSQPSSPSLEVSKSKTFSWVWILSAGILILTLSGLLLFRRLGSRNEIHSLAVMPFTNTGDDRDLDYLCAGLTENLINSLSEVPNLRVISRSAVFRLDGKARDSQAAGRQLGVDAVLSGRIVRQGSNLVVNTELMEVGNDSHLWGEQYSKQLTDLQEIQADIARDIAAQLRTRLIGKTERLSRSPTVNSDAYQLYLKGLYYWNKRDPESAEKSLELFRRALEIEPNFALAYVGIGDAYQFTREAQDEASMAAYVKAIALDPNLAEAHAGLGLLALDQGDLPTGGRELKRAIELNANYAPAHQWYSNYLSLMMEPGEAMDEIQRALALDPNSPIIQTTLGYRLAEAGRYDEAIQQYKMVLSTTPSFNWAYVALAGAYVEKGMFKEAIEANERAELLENRKDAKQVRRETSELLAAYEKFGPQGFWSKKLEMETRNPTPDSRTLKAKYNARLGRNDVALQLLKEAQNNEGTDPTIFLEPAFRGLHSQGDFQEIAREAGIPVPK